MNHPSMITVSEEIKTAKFKGSVLVCQACGKEFKVPSCRRETDKLNKL